MNNTIPVQTIETIVYIALFGALGALLRYGFSFLPSLGGIPMGTLLVNLLGSFVLGFLTALLLTQNMSPALKTGLTTGFLGAFTTFSTFTVESATLLQEQSAWLAGLNILGQVVGGLSMAMLGLYLGGRWSEN